MNGILTLLNDDRSIEEIVAQIGTLLYELIPCERISLGVHATGWLYRLEEGRFSAIPASADDMDGSATGWVVRHRQPLLRQDISQERQFIHDARRIKEGMRSDVIVPLVITDRTIGNLNFTSRTPNHFGAEHLAAAQALAPIVAEVIEKGQSRQPKYRWILDHIDEVVYHILLGNDPFTGTVLFVSQRVEAILGYYPVDFLTDPGLWFRSIHPDDVRVLEASTRKILTSRQKAVRNYRIRHKTTGEYRWMEDQVVPQTNELGEVVGFVGVARDVTEQKLMEKQVEESESRFELIAENINEVFYLSDLRKPQMYYISPAYEEIWQQPRQHLYENPKSFLDVIVPEDRERVIDAVARQLHGEPTEEIYRIVRPDGCVRWIRDRAFPLCGDQGEVSRITGVAEDITKQKQVETALRLSEERFRCYFDDATLGMAITSVDRKFIEVNRRLCDMLGYSPAELKQMHWFDVTHPDDLPRSSENLERLLRGQTDEYTLEKRCIRKDGRMVYVYLSMGCRRQEGGRIVEILSIFQDITERKRMEAKAEAHQQQLENLSRRVVVAQEDERRHLARELHDGIGQMLTAVALNLQTVLHTGERNDLSESIDLVNQTLQQVRDLSVELRPSVLDDLGLSAALRWLANRQAQRAGYEMRLDVDIFESRLATLLEVACFRVAQEALTNVARHAGARRVRVALKRHGSDLRLSVRDNGIGFDVSAAQKQAADGKSLGLLSMQERATLLGGCVEIYSAPGLGTEVCARFPLGVDVQAGEEGA